MAQRLRDRVDAIERMFLVLAESIIRSFCKEVKERLAREYGEDTGGLADEHIRKHGGS